ncbi:MAG: acyltransferase family protein [Polyangiaceae bacterium]|nr:acyltransferase family protein [Polyangiaceae bacterium]
MSEPRTRPPPAPASVRVPEPAPSEHATLERPGGEDGNLADAARELLSGDYYARQWGRLGMRNRSEEVDEFGLDPIYERSLLPALDFLHNKWFRTEVEGVQHVPSEGRAILVCNHSGVMPTDGLMLRTALRLAHPAARELRWLTEDFITHLPFVGAFMTRMGAVRACQENATRLLKKEQLVAVFPEGVKGIGKLYRDRYQLQRFGRGGFVRLAMRMRAPVVPCAIVGAEESSPMLARIEGFSRSLGLPYVPITPTFPLLGPVGLLPAPTKWRIRFGAPIELGGEGDDAADDLVLVGRASERARAAVQGMLDELVGARRSVFFG